MQGKHGHLSQEQKQLALRLHKQGWKLVEIAREIGCSAPLVGLMVRTGRHLEAKPYGWEPRRGYLSIREREQIMVGLGRGDSLGLIAEALQRSVSTISREVARGGGRASYSAWWCHENARAKSRRPKPMKLHSERLAYEVTERLEQLWSPQQIASRLRLEYPDDPEMHVSYETIYQSLFVQGRGALRRELTRCLRSGRTARKCRTGTERRGRLPGMVMISDRPAEVEDRAVPGHWEGDLILGENSRSAVGTLVERHTRFTLLLHLPEGKSAPQVEQAMREAITSLPTRLAQTITWDQGAEMAQHVEFTTATGIPIYFCDPRSPWQRGSNENTNGLLRQYLPKGTDLSRHSRTELEAIQASLNSRPRKTLGYRTPGEKLTELLALTP
ncbi:MULTISPECIES: IS30 family transposase [Nesterenkonia]|uniref:IS30 family transposase n=2 Tax=Nesterenkonia TaxID=57494 RepID=A0A917AV62_9MICC|nr:MULTISPECIES: IS30 family transposase [Nesterenkonia]MDR5712901.1 IS30 family transposase [Nesterenkonia flava]GGE78629.1 IS30 family transposase [Nesterenkonia cremea]